MLSYVTGDRNRFAQQLFTPLPERYDHLAEVLSMGQNGRWRRAMIDRIVPTGPALVLDVASGTAGVALQLAERTSADVVGVDLTIEMLARGQRNIAAAGQTDRVQLVAGRGEQLPFPDGTFDALTFTYLLRYVDDPLETLREMARVVKPGGAVAQSRILLTSESFLALHVVALHATAAPRCRSADRRSGMVPCRPVSRTQHLRSLPEVSVVMDGRRVAPGRLRAGWGARHESRWRFGDVGYPQGWLTKRFPRPAAPPPAPQSLRHPPPNLPARTVRRSTRPDPGRWRDWWTLLHPPYTAWHLSYVVIGACLAPRVSVSRLLGTLIAFLCAVGFAAHALDELHGRPLGTRIPTPALVSVTVVGLAGAVALGIVGQSHVLVGPLFRSWCSAHFWCWPTTWNCSEDSSIPISGSHSPGARSRSWSHTSPRRDVCPPPH